MTMIPDDVMKVAGGVVADLHAAIESRFGVVLTGDLALVEMLAKPIGTAIVAERERIAVFIEQRPGSIPDRQEIAAAIRKG